MYKIYLFLIFTKTWWIFLHKVIDRSTCNQGTLRHIQCFHIRQIIYNSIHRLVCNSFTLRQIQIFQSMQLGSHDFNSIICNIRHSRQSKLNDFQLIIRDALYSIICHQMTSILYACIRHWYVNINSTICSFLILGQCAKINSKALSFNRLNCDKSNTSTSLQFWAIAKILAFVTNVFEASRIANSLGQALAIDIITASVTAEIEVKSRLCKWTHCESPPIEVVSTKLHSSMPTFSKSLWNVNKRKMYWYLSLAMFVKVGESIGRRPTLIRRRAVHWVTIVLIEAVVIKGQWNTDMIWRFGREFAIARIESFPIFVARCSERCISFVQFVTIGTKPASVAFC